MCVSDDLNDSRCCLEQLVSMLEIVVCVLVMTLVTVSVV